MLLLPARSGTFGALSGRSKVGWSRVGKLSLSGGYPSEVAAAPSRGTCISCLLHPASFILIAAMLRPYKGIHPKIAAGCYVDPSAQIIGEVTIGENSSVWMNAVVRGDVYAIRIGKNSSIQDCSVLHGMREKYGVIVGDWVTVGHSVTLHGCTIGDRCLIGMGSVILNNAKVGEGSIIAAGTVIPENTVVEPFSLWMGVPGKFRKKTDDEKTQQMILQYAKNYLDYTKQYLTEM